VGETVVGGASDPEAVAGDLRVVLGQLSRRLREQGNGGDLTHTQTAVLIRLEREGPATMSALARAEGVRPQSIGALVGVLESAGLVSRAPDPEDGRKSLVSLTDGAREQFSTGRMAKEDWLSRAMRTQLTPAQQRHLGTCVDLLRRLANSP
jgi:DNA-binding MarR family transcriptional regulator